MAVAVADAETGDLSRMLRPVTCDLRPAACETEGKEKQGWTGTTNGEGACVRVCVCVCVWAGLDRELPSVTRAGAAARRRRRVCV